MLTNAAFWMVEDSRVSGKLAAHLGVKKTMRLVTDHTGDHALLKLVEELRDMHGALVSDAGSPGISDPGARLCDLCHEHGVDVDAIPGPSAPILALTLSGFYGQRFAFLGFLPRKPGPMRGEFAEFKESTMAVVFFESPFRVVAALEAAFEALGPRRYALCRELTKMHQQVYRGVLGTVPSEAEVPHKGEYTVVIEGHRRRLADSEG